MISITDLHGKQKLVNAELIEFVESNPDTQIVFTSGHRIYARESQEEIAKLVIEYRRQCLCSSDASEAGSDG